MTKKTPRAICLEILNAVERGKGYPDQLLSDSFKRYRHLNPLDRSFLTELVYGVLRWRGRLDWIICQFSKIPLDKIELPVLNILRLGIFQILFLTKTPASAAVNESAELAKRFRGKRGAGFVNGLLRNVIRKKSEISYPSEQDDPFTHLSVFYSHPMWLVRRWVSELGLERAKKLCQANQNKAPLVLRTNTLRIGRDELIEKLRAEGLAPQPTYYSDEGIVLHDPPPISELPFFKEGFFIIQDEASQLVSAVLDPRPEEIILDACAGPGGKTTHIAQKMENKGTVYAMDLTKQKLELVEESSIRLGIAIVHTVKGDATCPLPFPPGIKFDRVLADVPCSGFGTLRRNPDIRWRKTEEDIVRFSQLQLSILNNLAGYVRAGGVLVYSTCTVFQEENENVINQFLEKDGRFCLEGAEKILPKKCHTLLSDGCLKTSPLDNDMDGFFVARLLRMS